MRILRCGVKPHLKCQLCYVTNLLMQDSPFIPDRVLARSGLTQTCLQGDGSLTFAVKDCIDLAGLPLARAVRFRPEPARRAQRPGGERLLATGDWRVTGKAAMHELAFGVTGVNDWAGTPVNPQWPDRIVGGSSSGSGGGRRRRGRYGAGHGYRRVGAPASGLLRRGGAQTRLWCGQPRGVHPAASSLDCVGPIARSVALVERAMAAMVPHYALLPRPSMCALCDCARWSTRPWQKPLMRR
jgi:amidase